MFVLEFPQNLIGFIAFIILTKIRNRPHYKYQDAFITHVNGRWGALSLSKYIFADDSCYNTDIIKHEYGHRKQSQLLLFTYLFIIGFPSLIWCGLYRMNGKKFCKSYYWFYSEAWANQLGDFHITRG